MSSRDIRIEDDDGRPLVMVTVTGLGDSGRIEALVDLLEESIEEVAAGALEGGPDR